MPDVKEVFEMVTKQAPPTPDAFERQQREQRRAVRNRKVGVFAMVASLVLIAVVSYALLRELGDQTSVDEPPTAPAGPTDVFFDLSTGEVTPLPETIAGGAAYAVSPDGTMLAFEHPEDAWIRVVSIDGTDERKLSPGFHQDHFGFAPQWSPDGTEIVYASADSINGGSVKILVADVDTGQVRTVAEAPSLRQVFRLPSFDPDGRTILVTTSGSGGVAFTTALATVPAGGGEPTKVVDHVAFGTYSPDGNAIAFLMIYPADLWIADPDGGNPQLLVAGIDDGTTGDVDLSRRPAWSPDGTRIAFMRGTHEVGVVDVSTGEVTVVGSGQRPTWVDDDTLIVESYAEAT